MPPISDRWFLTEEAREVAPNINDTEYFALTLRLNCAVWSNDKKLKEQTKIKVYSTNELLELVKID